MNEKERNIGREILDKYIEYNYSNGYNAKHYVLDKYNLIVYGNEEEVWLDSYSSRLDMLESLFSIMTNTCNSAYDNNVEMLEHKEWLVRERVKEENRG